MADQLSLRLTGDVARLPRGLRPMLPKPADEPFDSPEHVFEPSWGGLRALAFLELARGEGAPRVRLVDMAGRDLAPHLPELHGIGEQVGSLPAILDGEIVVPDRGGRMDEAALEGRLADGQAIGSPPVFLVFDLLWIGGRPILAEPLVRRRERLAHVVESSAELVVVPGVVRDGRDLHAAAAAQGLPGIMARHLRSPYLPGRRSELWRWIGADAAHVALHLVAEPLPPTARPVLALIQRLPLDD